MMHSWAWCPPSGVVGICAASPVQVVMLPLLPTAGPAAPVAAAASVDSRLPLTTDLDCTLYYLPFLQCGCMRPGAGLPLLPLPRGQHCAAAPPCQACPPGLVHCRRQACAGALAAGCGAGAVYYVHLLDGLACPAWMACRSLPPLPGAAALRPLPRLQPRALCNWLHCRRGARAWRRCCRTWRLRMRR